MELESVHAVDPDPFTIGLGIFGAVAGGCAFLELAVTRRICVELQASERVERERALAEDEARRAAAVEPVR